MMLWACAVGAGATPYNATQVEVDGANGGLSRSPVAFGDFDNDGDLDILVSGLTGTNTRQLRVYRSNGNGTFNAAQIEVESLNNGLYGGGVAWGDFDNDGDLDILCSGFSGNGANPQLRVYRNNGTGTFNAAQIEVDGANGGLSNSGVAWGDFDNDGDLDILAAGLDSAGARQLRVYKNLGNGAFDAAQIEVDGAGGGLDYANVHWGDFDRDGDQDIFLSGYNGTNSRLKIYRNNGDGTFDPNEIDVEPTPNNGQDSDEGKNNIDLADYDLDGDLDLLVSGFSYPDATNGQLRIYKNNGDGTFDVNQVEVNGLNGGFYQGGARWGDSDNDGRLDILAGGMLTDGTRRLRVFRNTAADTFTSVDVETTFTQALSWGGVDWGDVDGDGDPDVVVSGTDGTNPQLRVYLNQAGGTVTNLAPAAPTTLSGTWAFTDSTTSLATFQWNAGVDSGTGASPEQLLTYDVQIATRVTFAAPLVFAQYDIQPPKVYGGGTLYGVTMKSTSPWVAGTGLYGLRTDTTYYFRVRTIDAGKRSSGWSGTGTLWTGVAPATSTLAATYGTAANQVRLSWNAPGDDLTKGNLTGNYRIQYSSNPAVLWSTSTTPSGAYTTTLATTAVAPGTAQGTTISVASLDYYYFVIWSQDDVGQFSLISNVAASYPYSARSVAVTGGPYLFGSLGVGVSSHSATVITVTNDGTLANTYSLSAATTTAGSPWTILSAGPTGNDSVVVYGAFHGTRPLLANFGPEDVLTNVAQTSNGTKYSINGTQTGVAVAVGASRSAWFRLDMPATSSTESPQNITVTITAGP
jgi:hypothetical protein